MSLDDGPESWKVLHRLIGHMEFFQIGKGLHGFHSHALHITWILVPNIEVEDREVEKFQIRDMTSKLGEEYMRSCLTKIDHLHLSPVYAFIQGDAVVSRQVIDLIPVSVPRRHEYQLFERWKFVPGFQAHVQGTHTICPKSGIEMLVVLHFVA